VTKGGRKMAKATLRKIMKRGHEIARKLEGDYRARLSYGLKVAWAEYKEGSKMTDNGAPQVVKTTMGQDRKVWLCVVIMDGKTTKTYPTKEQLKKEGCVWATSGMRSSWVLPVEDKEEAKAKYLEYKQRGYEVDIRATDKTMHMPLKEANAIWGTKFPQELIRELIRFKYDN
jgi:hypothetical protein